MLPISPPALLSNRLEALIKEARDRARGKGLKLRIMVRERRVRHHLTGRRQSETEMMRETVVGGEDYAVDPSSGNRGRSNGIGSNNNKVGSNISRAIAKSIIWKRSGNSKNGSKRKSGSRNLQAQGRRWYPKGRKQAAYTETPLTMMLKYWEALREVVRPDFFSPPRCQGPLRYLQHLPLWEGTVITYRYDSNAEYGN